jgi:hypothetical protein
MIIGLMIPNGREITGRGILIENGSANVKGRGKGIWIGIGM